jgi:hypothetical protein
MPIKQVAETYESRSCNITATEGTTMTRVFRVECTGNDIGPFQAAQAPGISLGDVYVSSAGPDFYQYAYCVAIRAVQESTGDYLSFLVAIEYGPYSPIWAGGGPSQNPLLQPIDVEWAFRDQEVIADQDIFGKAITNTAGDPYDPPLVEDDPRPTLSVVRNEPAINISLLLAYRNAINSDSFAGFPPLFARCVGIQPKSVFHQFVGWYYQVTYAFEFLSPSSQSVGINGYRRTVLNAGLNALSVVTHKPYRVTMKGIPVTEPVLLDSQGFYQVGHVPYYNIFQTKSELPFAAFNFDPLAISGQRSGFSEGYGDPGG